MAIFFGFNGSTVSYKIESILTGCKDTLFERKNNLIFCFNHCIKLILQGKKGHLVIAV